MKNTFSHSHHREHGGRLDIEIGDAKQELFYPQIKISAWNNEANFSVRYCGLEPGKAVKEDGKLKLKGKQEAHLYPKKIDLKDEHLTHRKEVDYSGPIEHSQEDFEHLKVDGHIIGRDSQEERKIRQEVAGRAHGKVLIVGLGLGVIQDYLEGATVIELNSEVIDFVKQNYPDRYAKANIIHADFYDWQTDEKFDFIYGDIFTALTPGHIADWDKFKEKAKTLLAPGGEIDGRIRTYAENWEQADYSEDGHEFEIILNEKPDSNVFPFSVQSKNAVFYYQPHETGEGEFRPESVKGSYAVYHSEKQNNEYATGKMAHIYRPKIHDTNGEWVYGELDYSDGLMNVIVPQDFLDTAVYPVTVDPTFGYTTIGATNTEAIKNLIKGTRFQGSFGTGQKITAALFNDAAIQVKANIYNANTLLAVPYGVTPAFSMPQSGVFKWIDFNFVQAPTFSSVDYYPVVWASGSGKIGTTIAFDAGTPGQGLSKSQTYDALWPDSIAPPTINSNKYSIYVTYTASTALQVPPNGPFKIDASLGALNSNQSSSQLIRTSTGNLYAVIVSSGDVRVYKSTNNGVGWAQQDYRNVPSTTSTVVAAAIDGTDTIHIVYINTDAWYITYNTSTDTFGRTESKISSQVNITLLAIAVDSNNKPHIAYAEPSDPSIAYSNRIAGTWKLTNTFGGLVTVKNIDIQIDNNNVPIISWTRSTGLIGVAIGNRNDASSFTSFTQSAGTASTTSATSLSIDSSNNVWVAYQTTTNRVSLIKHISTDAWATWQTAIDDRIDGKSVSLAADANDIYVFYERNLGGIAYDRYDTINGKWLGETIIQPATPSFRPHNPFVKWSQYFNNGDTAANNANQQTIEYLFDDGSTVYYDKLVTAQISTGFAEIKFTPAPGGATTTSTSSTSSSTSTSISTSSTSTSTSISTSSTSQSTSTSISTSSTSQSTSTSISTSSTSSSTSISTSSTSSSISTSSTSSSTSISTSSTSTSVSTSTSISTSSTSQSTSTSISTSSTSTSISTSSTSSSISTSSTSSSTSQSTSTSSTSTSTSVSTSTSISSTSSSTSISTSSTSSSTSISTSSTSTSVSTSTSISTSSTSQSTSTSISTSSTSSSISTSSTSSSISTSSTSSSTSISTSSTSSSTSTSVSTSTSSTSSSTSISTSSTSSSTSISTSSTSQSTSTSRSTSTSSTSQSTSTSISTSSTSSSISTSSTSSSTSISTSSTSQSTSTSISTSTSSTSQSTSTSISTSSTSSSVSTSSTSSSTSQSTSISTSSTSTSTTVSLTTSTSSTSSSISTSSTSSSTSISTSSTSSSISTSSTSSSTSISTSSTSSSTSTSKSTSTSSTSQSTSTSISTSSTSTSTSLSTSSTSTSTTVSVTTSTSSTSQSTSTSLSTSSTSTSTTVSITTSTSSTSTSFSSTSSSTSTTTTLPPDPNFHPRSSIKVDRWWHRMPRTKDAVGR